MYYHDINLAILLEGIGNGRTAKYKIYRFEFWVGFTVVVVVVLLPRTLHDERTWVVGQYWRTRSTR